MSMSGETVGKSLALDRKLMIKLVCPEEIGPIYGDCLNCFLRQIQKGLTGREIYCTLGARIVDGIDPTPVPCQDSDEPDSVLQTKTTLNSAVTVSQDVLMSRYYCKSCGPYEETSGEDELRPTVLIELFFKYDVDARHGERDFVVGTVKKAVKDTLLTKKRLPQNMPEPPLVNIISFVLVKTKTPACSANKV